jgi:hypothetical protein
MACSTVATAMNIARAWPVAHMHLRLVREGPVRVPGYASAPECMSVTQGSGLPACPARDKRAHGRRARQLSQIRHRLCAFRIFATSGCDYPQSSLHESRQENEIRESDALGAVDCRRTPAQPRHDTSLVGSRASRATRRDGWSESRSCEAAPGRRSLAKVSGVISVRHNPDGAWLEADAAAVSSAVRACAPTKAGNKGRFVIAL